MKTKLVRPNFQNIGKRDNCNSYNKINITEIT